MAHLLSAFCGCVCFWVCVRVLVLVHTPWHYGGASIMVAFILISMNHKGFRGLRNLKSHCERKATLTLYGRSLFSSFHFPSFLSSPLPWFVHLSSSHSTLSLLPSPSQWYSLFNELLLLAKRTWSKRKEKIASKKNGKAYQSGSPLLIPVHTYKTSLPLPPTLFLASF